MSSWVRKFSSFFILLMFCGALSARAGWNLLKTFSSPIVSGFFFDPDNGLIGMGSSKTNPPLAIYWTTNGGVTWTQSVTPGGGKGRVTSIFMKNAKTGYASLFCSNSLYSLWTTNDGGRTWTDFSFGNTNESASIYATSKAIIRTLWSSGFGGSSTDGGRNYSFTILLSAIVGGTLLCA